MKPYYFSKQLHSSFGSFSSSDIFLKMVLGFIDFPLRGTIKSKNPALNGEKIVQVDENSDYIGVYLEEDRTYDNVKEVFKSATKEQMQVLAAPFFEKGWTTEMPEFVNAFWEKEKKNRLETRTLAGFVIPEWSDKLTAADYRGGLSEEFFNEPYLQQYLTWGCHGYIGASERTFNSDRALEFFFRDNYSAKHFAIWASSRNGRHFADSLPEEIEDYIRKHDFGVGESWFIEELKK